jgi:hypothetical protein
MLRRKFTNQGGNNSVGNSSVGGPAEPPFLNYTYFPAVSAFHGDRYSGTIRLTRSAPLPFQNLPTWRYIYENGASVSAVLTGTIQGNPQRYRIYFDLRRFVLEAYTKFPYQTVRNGLIELEDPQFSPDMFFSYDELFNFNTLKIDGIFAASGAFDKSYPMSWYGGTVPRDPVEESRAFGSSQAGRPFPKRYDTSGTLDIICGTQGISYITSLLSDIVSPQYKQQTLAETTQNSFPFSLVQMDDERNFGYVRGNFDLISANDERGEVVVAGGVFSGTGEQPYCQFHDLSFVF